MFHFKIHYRLVNRGLTVIRTVSQRCCVHREKILCIWEHVGLGVCSAAKSDTARSLNDYVLRNTKCVKADVLKRFYGIYLRRSHAKGEALLRELHEGTRMKTPLIVNVDEFYMPYHFQHVYRKQHGVHTILLFHIDSK